VVLQQQCDSATLIKFIYNNNNNNNNGVQHHQFADDTNLHLAISADNKAGGLSILAACTADVRLWYTQNGPAQPGEVGGTHHWNYRSATRCHLCCVVGSCCQCRSRTTGGRRDEGSGRCSGPASDILISTSRWWLDRATVMHRLSHTCAT